MSGTAPTFPNALIWKAIERKEASRGAGSSHALRGAPFFVSDGRSPHMAPFIPVTAPLLGTESVIQGFGVIVIRVCDATLLCNQTVQEVSHQML